MKALKIKPQDSCHYDLLSLGEIMLRLDPGEGRIHTARAFRAWEGGGEYNVARGLRRCFGMRTGLVSALADNEIGRLLDFLESSGELDNTIVVVVSDNGASGEGGTGPAACEEWQASTASNRERTCSCLP